MLGLFGLGGTLHQDDYCLLTSELYIKRAKLQTMLPDRQELLIQVLDTLAEATVLCNADGKITHFNQAAQELFSLPAQLDSNHLGVQTLNLYRFDGKTLLPQSESPLYRALQGEDTRDLGLILYSSAGSARTVIANGRPLVNSSGETTGAVMTLRDITHFVDRRAIEASFKQQEELLRSVYDGIGAAVFTIDVSKDQEFRFSGLNPSGSVIIGMTPSDILYRTLEDAFDADIAQSFIQTCSTCIECKQQLTYETELRFRKFTNSYSVNLYPLFNHEGSVYRIVVTLIDITEQKLMLKELSSAVRNADSANQAKGQFLANISHELRTPLNAILGYSQLLARDTNLSERQRITLSTINRSGEHLLRLINDVLDLTKIDAGQIELQPEVCDLYRLLDDIYQMMSMRAKSKHIGFHFELDPDLPRFISIDAKKLRQILINLLGNAVKFTGQGEVRLHATMVYSDSEIEPSFNTDNLATNQAIPQGLLRLAVSDTGEGVAPEDIERLFQPFVQTESGYQQAEGSGLGLAISRRYARLMGGDIEVASQRHYGSQFLVTLACEEAVDQLGQPTTPSQVVEGLEEGQAAYRILLVDDRFENRDMLHQLLGDLGLDIQQARDGQEALEMWELWHPHLIFMDIRMPVMDGLKATQIIREREPNRATKILAITAGAFSSDREAVLAAGCDGFLVKPFKIHEIFEQLQVHLGLEYRYREQTTIDAALVPTANLNLSSDDMWQLNQHWLEQLKQACLEGDDLAAEQLVNTLPGDRQDTATKLSSLIADFHFDRIIEWIEAPSMVSSTNKH